MQPLKNEMTMKQMRLPSRRTLDILALVATLLLPLGTAIAGEPGFHQAMRWTPVPGTKASGEARALQITERRSGALITRQLVEPPVGHRAVVTKSTNGYAGSFLTQLVDDETGWWIELEIGLGFETENLKEFLNRVGDRINEPGATLQFALRTGENVHHEAEVPVAGQIHLAAEAFGKELAGTPEGRALAESIPPGLVPTLAFLRQHTEGTYAEGVISLTKVLAALQPAIADRASNPGRWRFEGGEIRYSLTVTEPELRSFMERFSTIDPDRPMEPMP